MAKVKADYDKLQESANKFGEYADTIENSITNISNKIKSLEEEKSFFTDLGSVRLQENYNTLAKSFASYIANLRSLKTILIEVVNKYMETDGRWGNLLDQWEIPDQSGSPETPESEIQPEPEPSYNVGQDLVETSRENRSNIQVAIQENAANTADFLDRAADSYGSGILGQGLAAATRCASKVLRWMFRIN